jgi:hypothetical protein
MNEAAQLAAAQWTWACGWPDMTNMLRRPLICMQAQPEVTGLATFCNLWLTVGFEQATTHPMAAFSMGLLRGRWPPADCVAVMAHEVQPIVTALQSQRRLRHKRREGPSAGENGQDDDTQANPSSH